MIVNNHKEFISKLRDSQPIYDNKKWRLFRMVVQQPINSGKIKGPYFVIYYLLFSIVDLLFKKYDLKSAYIGVNLRFRKNQGQPRTVKTSKKAKGFGIDDLRFTIYNCH